MSAPHPGASGPSSTGPNLQYSTITASASQSNLATVAPYLFWLMFRNVASGGYVFEDPIRAGVLSAPGCILASPSVVDYASFLSAVRAR